MLEAADPVPVTGPPWLAIVLAAIAVLGVIATAFGPALVERVKRGGAPQQQAVPAVEPAKTHAAADQSLAIVQDMVNDLQRRLDTAERRLDERDQELQQVREQLAERDRELADLHARRRKQRGTG